MFEKKIHTRIQIHADAGRVWEVLADLSSYPEWNPMIRHARGELREGERLQLHFEPEGRKRRNFKPKLLVVEPGRELRWQGQPGVRWLFESEHIFILQQMDENKTRLDHDMIFSGLLIPPVKNILEKATRQPFEDMNRALKQRSELKGLLPKNKNALKGQK